MEPVPESEIVHHIPGRLRLRVPRLKREPTLAEELGRKLAELEGVVEVAVRPLTGSVVLRYAANGGGEQTFVASLAPIVRVEEGEPAPPPAAATPLGETVAEWTREQWDRMDQGLRRATGGAVNMATVVPFFFLAFGVQQLLLDPNLQPLPWFVALYYGFESFRHYYRRPGTPSEKR